MTAQKARWDNWSNSLRRFISRSPERAKRQIDSLITKMTLLLVMPRGVGGLVLRRSCPALKVGFFIALLCYNSHLPIMVKL